MPIFVVSDPMTHPAYGSCCALHDAVRDHDLTRLKSLLEAGTSVNEQSFDGTTSLHEAANQGCEECVQILINAGARLEISDVDGSTALCYACMAAIGDSISVVKLLLNLGAQVNPRMCLSSPLHEAVLKNNLILIQLLINHGADLEKNDLNYGTPLLAACKQRVTSAAHLLLQNGSKVACRYYYIQPLHAAVLNQDLDMVQMLLNFGANPHSHGEENWTARDYVRGKNKEIEQFLLDYETHPKSLRQICRLQIRKSLRIIRPRTVYQLPLPKPLQKYVNFDATPFLNNML